MKKFEITTDKALIFSAIMLIIFTIVMVTVFCLYQSVPDSLIVAFFGAFGLEGGYCAFIQKCKKDKEIAEIHGNEPEEGAPVNAIGFNVGSEV